MIDNTPQRSSSLDNSSRHDSSDDRSGLPKILGFKRLRIACPNLLDSIEQYRVLLGKDPVWQGKVDLPERAVSCSAAHFSLENTTIELLELPDERSALVGIVFATEGTVKLEKERRRGLWLSFEEADTQAMPPEADISITDAEKGSLPVGSIQRVDHFVIYTHSADDSIRLFGDSGLGIRLALDKDVPEWGGRMLFFRVGKLTLEIIEPTRTFEGSDYFWGIAYQVQDIKAVHQRLRKAGVSLSDVRQGRKDGTFVASVKSHQLEIPTLIVQPS
ncbi:VOC family protein [Pseudomaricurvus sp.]|uniref:VOC family protein n=1 Tax=Pseudomaricurvus sp. TaxID=2004510 RepID=UPI003F6C10E6